MDFTKTKLLDDQLVKNAFVLVTTSKKMPKNSQEFVIATASILSAECVKKDPELVAAALLSNFELTSDPTVLPHLTPRIENIVNACTPSEALPLGDLNGPFGAELKLLHIASATAVLEDMSAYLTMELTLSPLANLFNDAAEAASAKEEIRQMKKATQGVLHEIKQMLKPTLGTTGEAKLEERFLQSYDAVARLVGERTKRPTPKKPSPPKPPTA